MEHRMVGWIKKGRGYRGGYKFPVTLQYTELTMTKLSSPTNRQQTIRLIRISCQPLDEVEWKAIRQDDTATKSVPGNATFKQRFTCMIIHPEPCFFLSSNRFDFPLPVDVPLVLIFF